jgi:hypothetical protein
MLRRAPNRDEQQIDEGTQYRDENGQQHEDATRIRRESVAMLVRIIDNEANNQHIQRDADPPVT